MSILARRPAVPATSVPLVVVHQDLITVSQRQIAASPRVETGGKFLGYVIAPGAEPPPTSYGQAVATIWRKLAAEGGALLLVGSISPGPRAQCSEVETFPDTEFQVGVFRTLEAREPAIEHLGSWHSHHPNGLARFSEGDLAHYRSVIADKNYGPDYFVAGLCVDERGLISGGLLEVFGRDGTRQALSVNQINTLVKYPSLQPQIEAAEHAVAARLGGASRAAAAQLASSRDEAADQMAAALGKRFTIRGRDEDDEAISWVIADRSGLGLQGVVTWAKGKDGPVAVSLEISHKDATLRYDGLINGDMRTLTARLQRMMDDLDGARRLAGRRR
jgi:hypothetical protein